MIKKTASYDPITTIKTEYEETRNGEINKARYRIGNDTENKRDRSKRLIEINKFEFLCLVLFTFSIIFLTSSFASLGIFYYSKHYN